MITLAVNWIIDLCVYVCVLNWSADPVCPAVWLTTSHRFSSESHQEKLATLSSELHFGFNQWAPLNTWPEPVWLSASIYFQPPISSMHKVTYFDSFDVLDWAWKEINPMIHHWWTFVTGLKQWGSLDLFDQKSKHFNAFSEELAFQ